MAAVISRTVMLVDDPGAHTATVVEALHDKLKQILDIAERVRPKIKDVKAEEVGEMVEQEMTSTTAAIEEAARHFEELLAQSRSKDTGVQLEENERIIDSCTQLMQNIRILIEKSRTLQKEIVASGRGASSIHEFYKKHSKWTEGLLSAAKSVAFGANALLGSADKLVLGEGKFEELIVCSQEIAACTTQLVVASQVKADPQSKALQDLKKASSGVTLSTGNVVAQAKSCAAIRDEQVLQDLSQISLTQSKRMEMDAQVKVLELESALSKERMRLAALRKKHYQLAGESEGWDEDDINNADPSS
jgi:huntingtin interacting protein 1